MIRRLSMSAAVLGVAVAMTLGTVPVSAQVVPQPAIGAPKPVSVPQTEDYQLPNGIKVTLVPYAVVPKAVVAVRVPTGNASEGQNTWLSDLTVSLMREGAGNRSGSEISQAFADMGGGLGTSVGSSRTVFSTNVLGERAPDAVALIADLMQRPTFPADALDRTKQGFVRNIAINLSTPSGQAFNAYHRTVFAGHPYAAYVPTEAQMQAYTLDQAKAFHARSFGPNGAHIYVGGQFDTAAVKAAIEQQFGGWRINNDVANVPVAPAVARRVVLVDRPGAVQSTLMLVADAPRIGGQDYIRAEVMDSLLGGSFNSRITTNIREDKGYTYSPYSALNVLDVNTTHWSQNADVTAAHTGDSLKEIFHEIHRLQNEAPTVEETTGTQNMSTGGFVMGMSTTNGVVNNIITLDDRNLSRDYYDRYIPWVMSVTPADIQQAAQKIDLNKMTVIVVGDLATVRPQLEALPEFQGVTFEVFQP